MFCTKKGRQTTALFSVYSSGLCPRSLFRYNSSAQKLAVHAGNVLE